MTSVARVTEISARCEPVSLSADGQITGYEVIMKVTFVLDE